MTQKRKSQGQKEDKQRQMLLKLITFLLVAAIVVILLGIYTAMVPHPYRFVETQIAPHVQPERGHPPGIGTVQ
ncbi:hypothetical protein [Desulfurispira natronophila]|uniref:Uncharacterized protein n=1 Tax=Desulfurispira natronophila TaxID=682562 RepID=A0A7W7Y5H9_9BACT|nr:hypothetical protein [Desulfurispira natronophila]MBB5022460.1 hypothetical protein [Desulfurispira natronophila]